MTKLPYMHSSVCDPFFSCRKITGSSAPELALSQFYIMNSPLLSVSWEISLNGSLNVFCCRRYCVCRKSLMNLARNVNRQLAISQRRRARLVTLWQSTESLLSEISCTKRAIFIHFSPVSHFVFTLASGLLFERSRVLDVRLRKNNDSFAV